MLLKNSRLYLRFLRKSDATRCFQAIEESRPELEPFVLFPKFTKTLKDEEEFIIKSTEQRKAGKTFPFAIFDLKGKAYLGGVGLHDVSKINQCCEIGYWVRTNAAGRGIATESAALVVIFAFQELKFHKVELHTLVDNHASNKIAENIGFRLYGVQPHEHKRTNEWVDMNLYSMLETEFRERRTVIRKLAGL